MIDRRNQMTKNPILTAMFTLPLALLLSFSSVARDSQPASGLVIQSDADFVSCGCVSGGTGSKADPYVVGPLSINNVTGTAVSIDGMNLTKSFQLVNLTISGNGAATNQGVVLNHINPNGTQDIVAEVIGNQTSIQTVGVGIVVENSSYVTLDGGGENPDGPGVLSKGAGTINKAVSGSIDLENSSYVTVKGWQMSASGASPAPDWITLDPSLPFWGVGGVRMFGVNHSTIDHNAANNCTSVSYSVFNSSHNTISNNTGDYPFVTNFILTDGSSYNIVTNNQFGTGDFINFLVADPLPGTPTLNTYGPSHDNVLSGNFSNANGPTGSEIKNHLAPAFLGGIVILNGAYNNTITGNTVTQGSGSGLTWAQAVPDNQTPIGVVTEPPTLHCNVTASEGGGGPLNLNGNVWSGNTFKTADSCIPNP
jgi:hypothetical protein